MLFLLIQFSIEAVSIRKILQGRWKGNVTNSNGHIKPESMNLAFDIINESQELLVNINGVQVITTLDDLMSHGHFIYKEENVSFEIKKNPTFFSTQFRVTSVGLVHISIISLKFIHCIVLTNDHEEYVITFSRNITKHEQFQLVFSNNNLNTLIIFILAPIILIGLTIIQRSMKNKSAQSTNIENKMVQKDEEKEKINRRQDSHKDKHD